MEQVRAATDEVLVVDNGEKATKPSTGLKLGVALINFYLAATFIVSSVILLVTGDNDASDDTSGIFYSGVVLAATNLIVGIACLYANTRYFSSLRPYVEMKTTAGDTVWVKHPDGKSFTGDQKPRIGAALLFLIPGMQFLIYGSFLISFIFHTVFNP